MPKQAVIVHSGGMDSTLCLALAMQEYSHEDILSLSFRYGQRHSNELAAAEKICRLWNIDHAVVDLSTFSTLSRNALTDTSMPIDFGHEAAAPTTLVVGRNGLMARLAAIHAHSLGAQCIYLGVMEIEAKEIGYRDCSEEYIKLKERILQIDLGDPLFRIKTPLIHMTKEETANLAHQLGILDFLLEHTISCYEGLPGEGCRKCPACYLKNRGLETFKQKRTLEQKLLDL